MNTPRQFSLMNGNGEELNLLTSSIFLYEPEGLGYSRNDEYRRVGNRWVLVSAGFSQNPISGKLCFFTEDPYTQYLDFIKFTQIAPLVLLYRPNPLTTNVYRRLVRISKLDKGEINQLGYLECEINFLPLAPWYRPYKDSTNTTWWAEGPNGNSWHWVMSGDQNSIKWSGSFAGVTSTIAKIESDSRMDSPCRIKIYGPMTNPSYVHYVDDKAITHGKILTTIPAGQYLMVDNTEDPYKIVLCDMATDEIVSNQYQNSDFTTGRFVSLQYGVNSIRFDGDHVNDTNMLSIEGMIYYESV